MFIVDSYALAVVFCFVTMLCWGSWGNTQKMAAKTWRYELFYWDYVIGMFLFALILSLTMGSFGSEGRPFLQDLGQASGANIASALLGGVIFNASNILLSASTALAGMAVAFPLGVGLALVLGVIINYAGAPKGDPVILFFGVSAGCMDTAPSTPILNTNIKIGSNIVFKIAPETIDVIAYFGFPSALIIEFNVVPIIINGNPIAII